MQALYVLGVVIAAVTAGYSAFVVGLEREREQRRRRKLPLFHVQGKPDARTLTALGRAFEEDIRRRAWGGESRRSLN